MESEPQLPESDNRCSGEKPDGTRCGAYRLRDSQFCNAHAGELQAAGERRRIRAQKAKELEEEFDFEMFSTKTRKDVAALTEKVINGVIKGSIRREKGGILAMFLPFAYKMAKDLEGSIPTSTGIKISVSETEKSMQIQMDEAALDKYLSSPDHVRIEMLEDLKKQGRLTIEKRGDKTLDVVATDVTMDEMKIPTGDFVRLSQRTDLPLTAKQTVSLFGRTLQDAVDGDQRPRNGPDMIGFGHIFDKGGLPEDAQHKWKVTFDRDVLAGVQITKRWFNCERCLIRIPNLDKGPCLPKKEKK